MNENNLKQPSARRGFLLKLASGITAFGLAAITSPFKLEAQTSKGKTDT